MNEKIDYDNADEMHEMTKDLRGFLNTFTSFKTPELEAELIKLQKALHAQCLELNKDDFSS